MRIDVSVPGIRKERGKLPAPATLLTARNWTADLRRAGRSSAVRAGDWWGSWRLHRERASGQRQNGKEYAHPLAKPLHWRPPSSGVRP